MHPTLRFEMMDGIFRNRGIVVEELLLSKWVLDSSFFHRAVRNDCMERESRDFGGA